MNEQIEPSANFVCGNPDCLIMALLHIVHGENFVDPKQIFAKLLLRRQLLADGTSDIAHCFTCHRIVKIKPNLCE